MLVGTWGTSNGASPSGQCSVDVEAPKCRCLCVCWVPKLSLQSWRCNQWSQRERLSDQPLHVYFKVSCFVGAALTTSHFAYTGSIDTFYFSVFI